MIVRNGIRATIRARGRTALFALLIFALTLTLTLGGGMWAYCAETLARMDAQYTSIALLEYIGEDYPSAHTADEEVRAAAAAMDAAAMRAVSGVTLYEPTDRTLAWTEGCQRLSTEAPYGDYGVIVVSSLSPQYQTAWREISVEELPQERLVIDYLTYTLSVRSGSMEYTDIPFYYYGFINEIGSVCYFYFEEDGSTVRVEVEDLPLLFATVFVNRAQNSVMVYDHGEQRYIPDDIESYEALGDVYYGVAEYLAGYTGIISRSVYTQEGKDNLALTVVPGESGFAPEKGKRYLIHGRFVESGSANRTFQVTDFYEGCTELPYVELESYDDPAYTDSLFTDYARCYEAVNNYIDVTASDNVAALEVFQQGTLFLEEGRFPLAGEAGACVVSGDVASQLGLALGDTLPVTLLRSAQDNRFDAALTEDTRALTVVGVTNHVKEYSGMLWVSGAEGNFAGPTFGDTLGRAVLNNRTARKAADTLESMVSGRVRVTLLDQGYSAAAQPLEAMRTTAAAVTAAALCAVAAVLFLFACLFVGRQRETVAVLVSLGTPGGKIRLWLLSGAAAVAGVSAAAGAAAGALSMGRIIQAAMGAAEGLYMADRRYSEAAVGVICESVPVSAAPLWPAVAAGVLVFVLALVLCLVFLHYARSESAPRRGRVRVRVPRSGTSTRGRGAARFALLSARRGGARSAVVPAAALMLALFLGILASTAQSWSSQVDELYRSTDITGQVCSTSGRQFTGLTVSAANARFLWQSGLLAQEHVALGWNYWLSEEMPAFGSSSFSKEARSDWIAQQPSLMALDHLSAAPEFFYESVPEVTWLDGWSEEMLAEDTCTSILRSVTFNFGKSRYSEGLDLPTYPCAVSRSFLERRGLELGDAFYVNIRVYFNTDAYELAIPLRVVGTFSALGSRENIYVPLSFWCSKSWITGSEEVLAPGERVVYSFFTPEERDAYFYAATTFTSCRFTLSSAGELDAFRDYLAGEGLSQPGRLGANRTAVLLRDQTFTETVGSLGRYITFSQILFPVIFAAVGLLGFVISWLMVNGRRMEFAIMRGLGASKGRVFASFFLEQAGLCLFGCLLGCLVLLPLGGGGARWLAALVFLGCYLAGCALSVLAVGRTHLMSLLSQRE